MNGWGVLWIACLGTYPPPPSCRRGRHGVPFCTVMSRSLQDCFTCLACRVAQSLRKATEPQPGVLFPHPLSLFPQAVEKHIEANSSPLSVDKCHAKWRWARKIHISPFYSEDKVWVGLHVTSLSRGVRKTWTGQRYSWRRRLKKAVRSVKNKEPCV